MSVDQLASRNRYQATLSERYGLCNLVSTPRNKKKLT